MSANTSPYRAVDLARATQMIVAQVTDNGEMFAEAVQAMFDDDYGLGGMGSTINVLRALSEDLAAAIVERHGDASADMLRRVLAGQLGEVDL